MIFNKYETKTEYDDPNLNYAIERYGASRDHKTYENIICPHIREGIPVEGYVGINIINLQKLFTRIKRGVGIGNAEFREKIRPLITEPLKEYYREFHNGEDPLWGAWYLAEDQDDPYGAIYRKTFSDKEQHKLLYLLMDPDIEGERIGFALSMFAGLTIKDVLNARYRDIFETEGYFGEAAMHVRGAVPKKTELTEYDALPRFAPLITRLYNVLLRRKMHIEKTLTFPVETEYTVFSSAGDLPIACAGTDFTSFTSMSSLAACAEGILKNDLRFKEMRMAYINRTFLTIPARFAAERSAAYDMARGDFGASLYHAGLSEDQRASKTRDLYAISMRCF